MITARSLSLMDWMTCPHSSSSCFGACGHYCTDLAADVCSRDGKGAGAALL